MNVVEEINALESYLDFVKDRLIALKQSVAKDQKPTKQKRSRNQAAIDKALAKRRAYKLKKAAESERP